MHIFNATLCTSVSAHGIGVKQEIKHSRATMGWCDSDTTQGSIIFTIAQQQAVYFFPCMLQQFADNSNYRI